MGLFLLYGDALQTQERAGNILSCTYAAFKKFIHKLLEVYFDDCTMFGLFKFHVDNLRLIFSHVVITTFKKFIHKFLEAYFDDCTMFGIFKCHVDNLQLMLDTLQRYQIALNLRKCLFCVYFGILLGHVVCKQGFMVDPAKITVIIN